MGFSRPEYWSGLPFPSPGDLPNPGIQPASLKSPAFAGGFFTTSKEPGHLGSPKGSQFPNGKGKTRICNNFAWGLLANEEEYEP